MGRLNIHVYPSRLTHESRIARITAALCRSRVFDLIEVIGVHEEGLARREQTDLCRSMVRLPRWRVGGSGFVAKVVQNLSWSFNVLNYALRRDIGCVNAHSLAVLPLCALISKLKGATLIYDTHELETETTGYRGLRQAIGRRIERWLIGSCDLVFVVGDSIADWYRDTYKIERPIVVRNIPDAPAQTILGGTSRILRDRFALPDDAIVFIYQGGLIEGRGIERLLDVFARVGRNIHLVVMGSGPLEDRVKAAVASANNIHQLPPVPPQEVLRFTQGADVGICLTVNSCLSHYYSLPNKIFEYLHAGIPVIVNPLFEQERMVHALDCGWVAPENDDALVAMIDGIGRQLIAAKAPAVRAAAKRLSWADESARLVEAYGRLPPHA